MTLGIVIFSFGLLCGVFYLLWRIFLDEYSE